MDGQDQIPLRRSTRENFGQPPRRFGYTPSGNEWTGVGNHPYFFTPSPRQHQDDDTRSVTSNTSRVSAASVARRLELAAEIAGYEERQKLDQLDHDIKLKKCQFQQQQQQMLVQQLELDKEERDAEAQRLLFNQKSELKKLEIQQMTGQDQEIEDHEIPEVTVHKIEQENRNTTTQRQPQLVHHTKYFDDGWEVPPPYETDRYSEMSDSRDLRELTAAMKECFTKIAEAQRPAPSSTSTIPNEVKFNRQTIGKELSAFDGTPAEWPAWLSEYKDCTKLCHFSDRENLQRLRKSLKGKAKEVVQSLLNAPENVIKIMETLEMRFGKPAYIMQELITKAKSLPLLTDEKPAKFMDFATAIQNLVTTAKSLDCKDHLCNPQLLMDLIAKLPNHLKYDWGSQAASKTHPNLEDFGDWVGEKAKAVSTFTVPQFGQDKKSDERPDFKKRTGKVLATANATASSASDTTTGNTPTACVCCGKSGHLLAKCYQFAKLSIEDRWKLLTDKRICFSCLEATHQVKLCGKKKVCGKDDCKYFHHPLLHKIKPRASPPDTQPISDTKSTDEKVLVNRQQSTLAKKTIYKIVPVTLYGPKSQLETFAIFDNASYVTLLDSSVATQLELTGPKSSLEIKGVGESVSNDPDSRIVSLKISGKSGRQYGLENVRTKSNLDMPTQSLDVDKLRCKWKLLSKFQIPDMTNAKPLILIGLDNVHLIASDKLIRSPKLGFVLGRTLLGWTIYGTEDGSQESNGQVLCIQDHNQDLNEMMKEHFKLENLGVQINERMTASVQDRRADDVMTATTRRIGDKWETGLIWKNDAVTFPDNKTDALKRLLGIEKRMDRDPEFAKLYYDKMQYYFDHHFARTLTMVEADHTNYKTWYIPHFGVFNPNKPGKIRLVFDAAAKFRGTSLNDQLLTGPDLLVSLPGSLIKFRQRAIGFSGDIKDFFPSVRIRAEDENSQRFLWRGHDREREPDVCVMQVCIFGAASSPYACQSAKNLNAKEFELEYPEASSAIVTKHYMDDYLDSADSPEEAIKIINEVIEVNQRGGFKTTNWTCTSKDVLNQIPSELRSTDGEFLSIDTEMKMERVLGLIWDPNTDEFGFNVQFHKVDPGVVSGERVPTKRDILKMVMSVFDPLGLIAPFTIRAKMLLQDIWRSGLGWDDPITDRMLEKWKSWTEQLELVSKLKIPRRYAFGNGGVRSRQLHVFCDAGEPAYGAVAYLRTETDNEVDVSLVMAKARVAPLKITSIPRLELQSALVASRLADFIKTQMELQIDIIHSWTDSNTVLLWLRSESRRFKSFVSHRLGEIEELTDLANWHWIPTKLNPADVLTKESVAVPLDPDDEWFKGPAFLYKSADHWPKEKPPAVTNQESLELRPEIVAVTVDPQIPLPDLARFSSWLKLIRATAWMLRFIHNVKTKTKRNGELTVQELENAELLWNKKVQRESFGLDISALQNGNPLPKDTRIANLTPIMDDGMLKVNGRLNHGELLSDGVKKPIILDNKHPYTRLLLHHHHVRVGHNGQERMANEVRQKYWVLNLRTSIRSTWSNCRVCQIRRAKPVVPMMGNLPAVRMEAHLKPFTNTGMDYFGPMTVTIGRRHEKRYGVLFTCLSTRAVHLEIADSLTTDSCIMAIQRMISRRGDVKNLYSDNGTNLVGADNELKKELKNWDQNKIQQNLTPRGIQWHFIPPAAPHMGGAWERLVQSVKKALATTLNEKSPREEVLRTLMTQAEFAVNSHPLTHVSLDSSDADALTPNHFLVGEKLDKPPIFYDEQKFGADLKRQWKFAEQLTNNFWRRWLREYLPTLTRRVKWTKPATPLEIGNVVIIADGDMPRNSWPRGIIINTFPGKDKQVRVVEVKTATGILKRPASKICKLDVNPGKTLDIGHPDQISGVGM